MKLSYQPTNTRALDKAIIMLFGAEALPLVHALYKGLDEMEFAGSQAELVGRQDDMQEAFEAGFEQGVDDGYMRATRDAMIEKDAEEPTFALDMTSLVGNDDYAEVKSAVICLGDEFTKGAGAAGIGRCGSLPPMQEQGKVNAHVEGEAWPTPYPANAVQPYLFNGTKRG